MSSVPDTVSCCWTRSAAREDTMTRRPKNLEMQELQEQGEVPGGAQRDINFIPRYSDGTDRHYGRTKILVQELLQLGQGSVVALENWLASRWKCM